MVTVAGGRGVVDSSVLLPTSLSEVRVTIPAVTLMLPSLVPAMTLVVPTVVFLMDVVTARSRETVI